MAERFKLNRFTDRLTLWSHTGTLEQKSKLRGNVRCLSAGWNAFEIRLFRLMQLSPQVQFCKPSASMDIYSPSRTFGAQIEQRKGNFASIPSRDISLIIKSEKRLSIMLLVSSPLWSLPILRANRS